MQRKVLRVVNKFSAFAALWFPANASLSNGTSVDIRICGDTLCQMALQIKCTGTEWKDHVKGNFAALQMGEEMLYYDCQHPGDKDVDRKVAGEFGLKFSDKPEHNTVSISMHTIPC